LDVKRHSRLMHSAFVSSYTYEAVFQNWIEFVDTAALLPQVLFGVILHSLVVLS